MVRVDITGVKDSAGLVFLVVEARALSGMLGSSVVRTSAAVAEDLLDISGASESMQQLVLAGGWNMKSRQIMYLGLRSQVFHYERKS